MIVPDQNILYIIMKMLINTKNYIKIIYFIKQYSVFLLSYSIQKMYVTVKVKFRIMQKIPHTKHKVTQTAP